MKKISELSCRCGCGFNNASFEFINELLIIEAIFKCDIIITSGCRCKQHNRNEGGADDSQHQYGDCCDFTTTNKDDLQKINDIYSKTWDGGFHYYPTKGIIHIDLGRRRRW